MTLAKRPEIDQTTKERLTNTNTNTNETQIQIQIP